MSTGNMPRDEAELEAFLARQSPLSTAYGAIEPVEPPEVLDAKILAIAKGARSAAPVAAPAQKAAAPQPSPVKPPAARPAAPAVDQVDPAEDEDDDPPPARRPRWLVPAALAASVLVAVGVGVAMLGGSPGTSEEPGAGNAVGSLFAKRARERSEADKASAEAAAAAEEAQVIELAPLPPPPVFEPAGPQVEDLDTAIALIRRELVMANQMSALAEPSADATAAGRAESPPAPAGAVADVVQPRDRRLAKILELYDGGNPDLAGASLEIFLRDFEDDPVSQRIIEAQPRPTDVAVE